MQCLKITSRPKTFFSYCGLLLTIFYIFKTRIRRRTPECRDYFPVLFIFCLLDPPRTNRTATFFHSSTCINNSLPDMPFCALPPYLAMRSGCYTVRCKRPFKVGCHCLAISGYIVARSLNPDKTFLPHSMDNQFRSWFVHQSLLDRNAQVHTSTILSDLRRM